MDSETGQLSRRCFLAYFSGIGMASTLLPGVLWAKVQEEKLKNVTIAMLQEAEKLAGLEFTDSERELMMEGLNENLEKYEKLRRIPLGNNVAPAIQFKPILPGMSFQRKREPLKMSKIPLPKLPSDTQDLAFWPVTHLSQLIKNRKIGSVELTKMYLERLKKYHPQLK